jgi:hypothetical protein
VLFVKPARNIEDIVYSNVEKLPCRNLLHGLENWVIIFLDVAGPQLEFIFQVV